MIVPGVATDVFVRLSDGEVYHVGEATQLTAHMSVDSVTKISIELIAHRMTKVQVDSNNKTPSGSGPGE